MDDIATLSGPELDETFFCAGRSTSPARALVHGNHPFGAILVDDNRKRPCSRAEKQLYARA